ESFHDVDQDVRQSMQRVRTSPFLVHTDRRRADPGRGRGRELVRRCRPGGRGVLGRGRGGRFPGATLRRA
ncbi:hypothetical protein AB0C70_43170, partial [Streptomyces sp. NPDC048564]